MNIARCCIASSWSVRSFVNA